MPAYAIGDPQAPLPRLLAVLATHDLLDGPAVGPDARLRSDVRLLVVGDYFDRGSGPDSPGLKWLASHPADQVVLLLGNHDAVRVIEFWRLSDDDWADATRRARDIQTSSNGTAPAAREAFFERHPDIPEPVQCVRDFQEFAVAGRSVVQGLLLEGRLRLGCAVTLADGTRALATHTGLTSREVEILGPAGVTDPDLLADALDAFLKERVDRVREAWTRGEPASLDLRPLTTRGEPGREAGGLLHQRPANPDLPEHPASHYRWEHRRKFDPCDLPLGLVQIIGHTTPGKALEILSGYETDPRLVARPAPRLRVLETDGEGCWYRVTPSGQPNRAVVHLVDGCMSDESGGDRYPLLPLRELGS